MVMVVVNDSALVRSLLLPRYAAVAASVSRIRTKGAAEVSRLHSTLESRAPASFEWSLSKTKTQKKCVLLLVVAPATCVRRGSRAAAPSVRGLCAFLLQ